MALTWAIFDVRGFGLVDDHILYADTYWAKHFYFPRNLDLGRFFPANGLEFSLLRKVGVAAPWVFRAVAAMKFALAAWLVFSALGRGGFRGWGRTALGLLVLLTPAMACASQRLFVGEINLFIGLLVVCLFWPEPNGRDLPERPRRRRLGPALRQAGVVVLCAALCFYKETVAPMLVAAGGAGLAAAFLAFRRKKTHPPGGDGPTGSHPSAEAGLVWFHIGLMVVGAAYLIGYALFVLPHRVQSGYLALQAKDSPAWALTRYLMNDPALLAGLALWGWGLVGRARRGRAFQADAALFAAALALTAQYVALGLYAPYYLLPAYALAASRLRPEDLGLAGGTAAADSGAPVALAGAGRALTAQLPKRRRPPKNARSPALRALRATLAGLGAVLLLGSLAAWANQFTSLYYSQKHLSALEGFLVRLASTRADRPVSLFTPQATPDSEATLALGRLIAHLGLQTDIDLRPDIPAGRAVRAVYPAGAAPDDAVLLTPLTRLAPWEARRMERDLPVLFATRSPWFVPDYSLEGFWLKWPGSHMSLAELNRRRAALRPDFLVLAPRGGAAFTPFDLAGLELRILKSPTAARPWSEKELLVEVTNRSNRTWLAPPDDEDGGVVLGVLFMRPNAGPRIIGRAFLPGRIEPGERIGVRAPFRMPLGTGFKVIGAVAGRLTENGLALAPGGSVPYVLVREVWGPDAAP
ncbi:hypothetical protein JCM15519_11990 [Fundidesulfovibrio butyratiphilus]